MILFCISYLKAFEVFLRKGVNKVRQLQEEHLKKHSRRHHSTKIELCNKMAHSFTAFCTYYGIYKLI